MLYTIENITQIINLNSVLLVSTIISVAHHFFKVINMDYCEKYIKSILKHRICLYL